MPTSPTAPSTPRLSEVARHVVIPAGIVSTAWPRVVAKCDELGVGFDQWQHGIGSCALGKRDDGKYAASVGGIVLSIPRQVGKTFLVGMIVIALCLLFPGLTVLWTAHRTRTATKTFHTLKTMTGRSKIRPHMLAPRVSNGEQEVRFRNGSRIMFGAREQGFGRGFDEVDVEVFDEAQILSAKALEDLVPATNQSRQAAGALLFFMGTPPRPTDPGEEFTARRAAALAGETEDTLYVEFSADDDAEPDDREQWSKANPSFPARTPVESMKRMRAQLTDVASFRREALGVWDPVGADSIPIGAWNACRDPRAKSSARAVFAVDIAPDRSSGSIGVASRMPGGKILVEVVDHRPGTAWLIPKLIDLSKRWRPGALLLDPGAPAGSLVRDLTDAKIEPRLINSREYGQSCGAFYDAVMTTSVRHLGDPLLDASVGAATKRKLGDAWAWDRLGGADITPLVACTLAFWGVANRKTSRFVNLSAALEAADQQES